MELSNRQKLTIEHLNNLGIKEPLEIVEYCIKKIALPAWSGKLSPEKKNRNKTRKHSRLYYQQIIDYIAQGKYQKDHFKNL